MGGGCSARSRKKNGSIKLLLCSGACACTRSCSPTQVTRSREEKGERQTEREARSAPGKKENGGEKGEERHSHRTA